MEAAETIIGTFSAERRSSLPFANGGPGIRWVRFSYSRHTQLLRYAVPTTIEQKRFRAVNATTFASQFVQLEELKLRYCFTAERVWNLDETVVSSGRDTGARFQTKRFPRRGSTTHIPTPCFSFENRVTILRWINAAGDLGPTLFTFKGTNLPYREVVVDGNIHCKTVPSYLPRGSLIKMREELAGVDSEIFYDYAKRFIEHLQDLSADNRHVLLKHDACHSHMSLRTIELFRENNMVVYP